MSMLTSLHTWAGKRRRLLAGLVGVAVETAAASVPGVNLAAKFLGSMIQNATEDILDPDTGKSLPAEQLAQVNTWLEQLTTSYGGLLDRLERMPLPDTTSVEELTRSVKESLLSSADLARQFDACLVAVRQQTLSLGLIEGKLDEHFHVQQQMQAGMEEIKDILVRAPMASEWAEFRSVRPDAVIAVRVADEHFLVGRREQGVAVLLRLLQDRGVGAATLAHQLGVVEFGQGKLREAATRLGTLSGLGGAVLRTRTSLSTLSGRGAGPAWRSLPRGFRVNYKYQIEEEVGRGGMASVYRAVLTESFEKGQVVALKVPAPALAADGEAIGRFQREIAGTRRLSHPHIVRVHGYEIFQDPFTGGRSYALVMDFVPGVTLAKLLALRKAENRPLSVDEVKGAMARVCSALEYAHGEGLLHRDVKPHNVMTSKDGVKLMDFGIARELSDSQDQFTKSGQVVGTLAYMAPEMLHPDPANPVSAKADVYMAGVLLTELLTFHPGGDPEGRSDLPPGWSDLVSDAQHRLPRRRPTMKEFRERLLGRGTVVPPVSPLTPTAGVASAVAAPAESIAWPLKPSLQRELVNSVGMRFALIPAGKFLMGSPESEEGRSNDEGPQHEVEITQPFYLGVYPVTVKEFEAFVEATGHRTEAETDGGAFGWTGSEWKNDPKYTWKSPGWSQVEKEPVVCVSWNDAQAFCAWLNKVDHGRRYRLPSEAEWEYSCRGPAASYQPFHLGNSPSAKQANFDGNFPYGGASKGENRQRTVAVDEFAPNGWGLYQMHGNVWEWCNDWYAEGYYAKSPKEDPQGPSEGSGRVFRGGCWHYSGRCCRSAYRRRSGPACRSNDLGFRVALVSSGQSG